MPFVLSPPDFSLRLGLSAEYNRTINSISMEDTDSYSCKVWNMDSDEKTKLAEFDVIALEKPRCGVSGGSPQVNRSACRQNYDFPFVSFCLILSHFFSFFHILSHFVSSFYLIYSTNIIV